MFFLHDTAKRDRKLVRVADGNERVGKAIVQDIARARSVVGNHGQAGRQLLEHGQTKPFHVARKRPHRAVPQERGQFFRLEIRNQLERRGTDGTELAPDGRGIEHGSQKSKLRRRYLRAHARDDPRPVERALPGAPHSDETNALLREPDLGWRRSVTQGPAALFGQAVGLHENPAIRSDLRTHAIGLGARRHVEQIGMANRTIRSAQHLPAGMSVEEPAEQFALPEPLSLFLECALGAIIAKIKTDRASYDDALETKRVFGLGESANQGIDHVKAMAIFPHVGGRFANENQLPERKARACGVNAGKGIGETEFFHGVTRGAPLLRQFHPDARRPETRVPGEIYDRENAERFGR